MRTTKSDVPTLDTTGASATNTAPKNHARRCTAPYRLNTTPTSNPWLTASSLKLVSL